MMTEAQFERLPKYARMEIERLRDAVEFQRERAAAVEGEEPTEAFIASRPDLGIRPLPPGEVYRFYPEPRTEEGRSMEYFTVRMSKDGELKIHTGTSRMTVQPGAANAVALRCEDR